jgi:hypothetical protein
VVGAEIGTLAGPAATVGGSLGSCFLGGGIAVFTTASVAADAGVALGGAAYAANGLNIANKCYNQ